MRMSRFLLLPKKTTSRAFSENIAFWVLTAVKDTDWGDHVMFVPALGPRVTPGTGCEGRPVEKKFHLTRLRS